MELKKLHSLLAAEHTRLHVVSIWPPSIYRDLSIRAIESSIKSLTRDQPAFSFKCMTCLDARSLMSFPMRPAHQRGFSKAA